MRIAVSEAGTLSMHDWLETTSSRQVPFYTGTCLRHIAKAPFTMYTVVFNVGQKLFNLSLAKRIQSV